MSRESRPGTKVTWEPTRTLLAKIEIAQFPVMQYKTSQAFCAFSVRTDMDVYKKHIIIVPYFCQEEIRRYLKIADRLTSYPEPEGGYHFLLASSPKTEPSRELFKAFSSIGNAIRFACPTRIFGYPEGPTAMFWDCMDFIAEQFQDYNGFSLWLESDMAPIKRDWIDRLSRQWFSGTQTPIMMGCYVPEVHKQRLFRKPKLILDAHINGGACYSLNFAKQMPLEARQGVFDMAVFEYARKLGRARFTRQISFSTISRVRRDLLDNSKVLLHGFMQDKDQFIDGCLAPLTIRERKSAALNPYLDMFETLRRQIRVKFVRKGHRAMLENMFLAKQQYEQKQHLLSSDTENPWRPARSAASSGQAA